MKVGKYKAVIAAVAILLSATVTMPIGGVTLWQRVTGGNAGGENADTVDLQKDGSQKVADKAPEIKEAPANGGLLTASPSGEGSTVLPQDTPFDSAAMDKHSSVTDNHHISIGWKPVDGTKDTPKQGERYGEDVALEEETVTVNTEDDKHAAEGNVNDSFRITEATMRSTTSVGLRFVVRQGRTLDEQLKSIPDTAVKYGVLVIPTEYLTEDTDLRLGYQTTDAGTGTKVGPLNIVSERYFTAEAGYLYREFTGVVTGIFGANQYRQLTAVAYIRFTDLNGTERLYYSDPYTSTLSNGAQTKWNRTQTTLMQEEAERVKAVLENTLCGYQVKADEYIEAAHTAVSVPVTGTTYYVSNTQTGTNYLTLSALYSKTLNPGDAVLFHRGETFRFSKALKMKDGVSYGAYGTGANPQLLGSAYNYAQMSWKRINAIGDAKGLKTASTLSSIESAATTYIGKQAASSQDSLRTKYQSMIAYLSVDTLPTAAAGKVYMYDFSGSSGYYVGNIQCLNAAGKVVCSGRVCYNLQDLRQEGDYYWTKDGHLYVFFANGPTAYASIEIGRNYQIFEGSNINTASKSYSTTIAGLTFKYGGRHAIRFLNSARVTVKNCEIGFIGGTITESGSQDMSLLNGWDSPLTTHLGNGVELYNSITDATVQDCWIYQIYDSGLTHQGNGSSGTSYIDVKNILFKHNLIEQCGYGCIEYWHYWADIDGLIYEDNFLRAAGNGFFNGRLVNVDKTALISSNCVPPSGSTDEDFKRFTIRDNIFSMATTNLLLLSTKRGAMPTLSGNTYIQNEQGYGMGNGTLGFYGKSAAISPIPVPFNEATRDVLRTVWGDKTARVLYGSDEWFGDWHGLYVAPTAPVSQQDNDISVQDLYR